MAHDSYRESLGRCNALIAVQASVGDVEGWIRDPWIHDQNHLNFESPSLWPILLARFPKPGVQKTLKEMKSLGVAPDRVSFNSAIATGVKAPRAVVGSVFWSTCHRSPRAPFRYSLFFGGDDILYSYRGFDNTPFIRIPINQPVSWNVTGGFLNFAHVKSPTISLVLRSSTTCKTQPTNGNVEKPRFFASLPISWRCFFSWHDRGWYL